MIIASPMKIGLKAQNAKTATILQRSNITHNNNYNWLDSFAGKNMVTIEVILSDSQNTTYFITTEIFQRFCDVLQHEIRRVSSATDDRMNINAIGDLLTCEKNAISLPCFGSASQDIGDNLISIKNNSIGDESCDTGLSARSLVSNKSLIEQSVVALELLQNDATNTLYFTKNMWENFEDIMNRKIARILATASQMDRISEINSVMDLFSENWFRGESPISRKSLIWDFRCANNSDDLDESSSSDGLTNDSTVSAESSLDPDDFETTVSTSTDSDNFDFSVDDDWLDFQLKKLYKADN